VVAALVGPEAVASAVGAYNAAIARVASAEGAVVVDLHQAALRSRDEGRFESLVGRDGFHPSTLGHRAVADTFAAAL
jgi:lysophospholipase L1-like esterase